MPQAMADLDWKPEFGLLDGLKDSYSKDFGRGTFRKVWKCIGLFLDVMSMLIDWPKIL